MTYEEFEKKYKGKAVDFDGRAGVQCVDLADRYLMDVIGIGMSEMPWVSGAKEFYSRFDKFPALVKHFDRIPNTRELVVRRGDLVVWGGGTWGHIGIGTGVGDIDRFETLEENTLGRHEPTQLVLHRFAGRSGVDCCNPVLGVLRPKAAVSGEDPHESYRITYRGGMNIRAGAGVSNKVVGFAEHGSVIEVKSRKRVGTQYWGELADGRGWICLTGFAEKIN